MTETTLANYKICAEEIRKLEESLPHLIISPQDKRMALWALNPEMVEEVSFDLSDVSDVQRWLELNTAPQYKITNYLRDRIQLALAEIQLEKGRYQQLQEQLDSFPKHHKLLLESCLHLRRGEQLLAQQSLHKLSEQEWLEHGSDIYRLADQAMREAKEQGDNHIVVALRPHAWGRGWV